MIHLPRQKPLLGTLINPDHPLARGLVGCWLFNEGSGNKAWDHSGNGNHGTAINGPLWVSGGTGKAMQFDGVDDYVDMGDVNALDGISQFTISAFVKTNTRTDYDGVVGKVFDVDGTGKTRFFMSVGGLYVGDKDDVNMGVSNGLASNCYTTGNILSDGVWNHWVMVYNGNGATNADKVKFFFNGNQQVLTFLGNPAATTPSNAATLKIGNEQQTRYFDGIIDNVCIYTHALSPSEIQSLYINPYQMWDRKPISYFYAAAGATYNLSGTATCETSTPTPICAVLRNLAGTATLETMLSTPISAVLRALSGTALPATETNQPIIAITRNVTGTVIVETTVSTPVLPILRELSGTTEIGTDTPATILSILRTISGTVGLNTSMDDIIFAVTRALFGTSASETASSSPILGITRSLAGIANSYTETAAVVLGVFYALSGTAALNTSIDDIILGLECHLSGTGALQTTTGAAIISVLRSLSGNATLETILSEIAVIRVLNLTGIVTLQTITSAIALIILVRNPTMENITPTCTMENITPTCTMELQ